MRAAAFLPILFGLAVPTNADAQGRRAESHGIPPGHLPPPGECRVWYYGTPPGQQPPLTDCRTAEATASRDPSARVVYGDDRQGRYTERDRRRRTGRAVPRRHPDATYPAYPGRTPYPQRQPDPDDRYPSGRYEYAHPGREAGYRDGLEKGRDDASRNRRYEPNRHRWYRTGTRGYDRSYGSKDEYINIYREGFTIGYAEGFRYR
jgi:hypothetical protein